MYDSNIINFRAVSDIVIAFQNPAELTRVLWSLVSGAELLVCWWWTQSSPDQVKTNCKIIEVIYV